MLKTLWDAIVAISALGLLSLLIWVLFFSETKTESPVDPYAALFQIQGPERPAEGLSPVVVQVSEVDEKRGVTSGSKNSNEDVAVKEETNLETTELREVKLAETQKSLSEIEEELKKLPPGAQSAPDRAKLLQSASQLSSDDASFDQVHDLALQELLQEVDPEEAAQSPSSSFVYFLPVLAHEVALKTSYDEYEAIQITLDGFLVHRDSGVRHSLFRNFVERYPASEGQLREALYIRNWPVDESLK